MPESTHTLNVNIRGDNSGFRHAVKDARDSLQSFNKAVDSETGKKTANAFNSAAQGIRNMVKEMQLASGKKVYTDEYKRIQKDVGATTESIKKMEHELGVMEQAGKNLGTSNKFRQAEQQAEALQHRYEQLNAVRNEMTKNPAYSNMEKSLEISNQRLAQLIENNKILKNQGADKELSPQYEKLVIRRQKFEEELKSAQAEMQRLEREGAAYKTNDKYTAAIERVNKAKEAIQQYIDEIKNSKGFSLNSPEVQAAGIEAQKNTKAYRDLEKELADAETALASFAGKEKVATDEMKVFQRAEREAGKELAVINTQMEAMEKSGGKFGSKEWQANLKGIEAEKKAQTDLNNEIEKMRENGTMYLPKDEEEKQQKLESISSEIEDQKKQISEMQEMRDSITTKPEDASAQAEYAAQEQALDGLCDKMDELVGIKGDLEKQLGLSKEFDDANRTIEETTQKLAAVNREQEELYARGESKSVNEDFKAVQDAYESKQKEIDRLEERKKQLEEEGKAYDPPSGVLGMPQDYMDAENKLKLAETQLAAAEAAAKAAKEQDRDTAEQELKAARQARDEARKELTDLINERGMQGAYHESSEYRGILEDLQEAKEELSEFKSDYESFDKNRRIGSNRYQDLGKQEEELMKTLEEAQQRRDDAMSRGALQLSSTSDLEDQLRSVQEQIDSTDKEITSLFSKQEALSNYMKGLGDEEGYQGLIDTLDNIKEEQKDIIEQFEELSKKKEELDKERASVQAQRDNDAAALAAYEQDEAEGNYGSEKKAEADRLRTRIASADERLTNIDSERSGLDNQLSSLQEEIGRLTEQYDDLIAKQNEFISSGNYSQQSQAYDDLTAKIEERKARLEELKALEAQNEGNTAYVSPEYEDLQERIRAKELEAQAAQEQANAYSEKYSNGDGTVLHTEEYDEIVEKVQEIRASLIDLYAEQEEMESSGTTGGFMSGYTEEIEAVKAELASLEEQKASIDAGNGGLANQEAEQLNAQIVEKEARLQALQEAFATTMNSATLSDMPIVEQLQMVDQAIEQTTNQIAKMDEHIQNMKNAGIDRGSDEYVKMLERRMAALERLNNLQEMSAQLEQRGADVEDNTGGMNASAEASRKLANSMRTTGRHGVSAAKSLKSAWGGISKMFQSINETIKRTGGTFASLIRKFASGVPLIGNAFGKGRKGMFGDTFKNMTGPFSTITGNVMKSVPIFGKLFNSMQSGRGSVTSFLGTFTKGIPIVGKFFGETNKGHMSLKKGFTTFIKYAFGVRSLYFLFRRLRSAVKDAFNNIAKEDDTTKRSLDDLSASMNMLKNSIGAAFAPILNVVAPILSKFIQMIAEAMNSIGAFFAALTGQSTYQKAVYNLKAVENAQNKNTKSAKNATKANKEMKNTVLAFDELNKLNDNSTDNNSGDTGSNFNMAEVPNQFADWAAKFRDAWAKADFTEIGREIGDLIGTLLYKIPWVEIERNVTHLAKSLGTFVNGLIQSNKLWQAFGYTAARALNVVMKAYNQFMKQIDFKKYGQDLSQLLKMFKDNFNWMGVDGLGETLSAMPNAMIDTMTGFLNDFTWQDFKDIGSKLGGAINQAIRLTRWEDFFPDMVKLAQGVLAAINGFIERQPWNEIIPKIKAGMEKISQDDWTALGTQIGDIIKNGLNGVSGILNAFTALLEGLSWTDIFEGVTTSLSQYTGWSTLGKSIGDAIYAALKTSAEIAGGFIDVLKTVSWRDIFDSFSSTIVENMKSVDWKDIGSKIGDAIGVATDILNGVLEGFTRIINQVDFAAVFDGVKDALQTKMNGVVDVVSYDEKGIAINQKMTGWQKLGHNLADAIASGLKAAGDIAKGFVDVLSSIPWGQVWDQFNATIGSKMSSVNWTGVGDTIGKAISTGLKNIGGIAHAFTTVMQSIRWDDIFSGIKDTINAQMSDAVSIKDVDSLGHVTFKKSNSWSKLGADIGEALKQGLKAAIKVVLGITEIIMSIDWHALLTNLGDHLFGNKDGKFDGKDWDALKDKIKETVQAHTKEISIIPGLLLGSFLIKQLPLALTSLLTKAPLAASGMTLGAWTQNIVLAGALALSFSRLGADVAEEGIDSEDFMDKIGRGITGAIAGFVFTGFNPVGAILGFSLGVNLDLLINAIKPTVLEKIPLYRWVEEIMASMRENETNSGSSGRFEDGVKHKDVIERDESGGTWVRTKKTKADNVPGKGGSFDPIVEDDSPIAGGGSSRGANSNGGKTRNGGGNLFTTIWDFISSPFTGHTTYADSVPIGVEPYLTKNGDSLYTDLKKEYSGANKENPLNTILSATQDSAKNIISNAQKFLNGERGLTTEVKEKSDSGVKIKGALQTVLNKGENTLNANVSTSDDKKKNLFSGIQKWFNDNILNASVTASEEKKQGLFSSIQTWFNENPIGITVKKAASTIFSGLFGGGAKEKEEQEETVNVKLNATETSKKALRDQIQTYFDGDTNQIKLRFKDKANANSSLKTIIQDYFDGDGHEIKMRFKDAIGANSILKSIVQEYFSTDGHEIKMRFLPGAGANATLLSKIQEYFDRKGNEIKTYFLIATGVLLDLKNSLQDYFTKKGNEIVTYFRSYSYAGSGLATDIQNYFTKDGHEITTYFTTPSNKYVGSAATLFGSIQSYFDTHYITVYTQTSGGGAQHNESGGIFNNGRWQPVTTAASGGTFDSAQMFIAREAGPELVGTIGNKTAVVNNDQIVASVAAGVFEAVVSANQQSQGGSSEPITNDITIMIDSERAYRVVQKGKKLAERRYGTSFSI